MTKYRKKPVVVEAMQWQPHKPEQAGRLIGWIDAHKVDFRINPDGTITISTLEGDMIVSVGDWVIKGIRGEFYPCKPDIFDATYEECVNG